MGSGLGPVGFEVVVGYKEIFGFDDSPTEGAADGGSKAFTAIVTLSIPKLDCRESASDIDCSSANVQRSSEDIKFAPTYSAVCSILHNACILFVYAPITSHETNVETPSMTKTCCKLEATPCSIDVILVTSRLFVLSVNSIMRNDSIKAAFDGDCDG